MFSDEELMKKIDKVSAEYVGQLDDLNAVVGMLFTGRLYGWRVQRLITPRRVWGLAIKLFGDPKLLMPERGPLAYKSVGLKIVDEIGGYWDVVKGAKSFKDSMPTHDKKMIM
jgi:hypothetical protein